MAKHSLVGNIIAKGTLTLFNALLPLIVTRYVYRVLGPANIGSIEYASVLVGYFLTIGMLGTYNYGLREISANRSNPALVRQIFRNLWCINILGNLTMLVAYIAFVYYFIHDPMLRNISWILSGNLVAQVFYIEWYVEAIEEFSFITIKTILIRTLSLIFFFIFVKSENDVYTYVFIPSVVTIVGSLVSYIYGRCHIRISTKELYTGLNFRLYIVPLLTVLILNNTAILYTMADRTILGYFTNAENVAYFSLGQKIVEMTRLMMLSIVFATLPRLSFYLKEDKQKYQETLLKVMRLVLFLALPMATGMCLLSGEIVDFFGGADFEDAVPTMRLFSISLIFLSVEAIMYNQIIFLHGKERLLVVYNICCGVLNVALNLVVYYIFDLTPLTSCACTFVSQLAFQVLCIMFIRKQLKIRLGIFTPNTLRYLLASLVFVPIALTVQSLGFGTLKNFIIIIPLCAAAYALVMRMAHDEPYLQISGYVAKLLARIRKSNQA